MQKVILNAEIHTILPTLTEDVLIMDESGKRVGMFVIAEHMIPPVSKEELLRRKNSTEKRLTTAELLASLEHH